jgi:hypothetical protein
MLKKIMAMLALATFVAAFALGSSPATTHAKARAGRAEGTLTAVDTARMTATITRRNGTTVTVSVTLATKIERNGEHVPFSALKIGDHAQARFNPATMTATKLESVGP